jgi:DNA processing protein
MPNAKTGTIEITDKKYPSLLSKALGVLQPSLGPKKLYYKGNWEKFFPAERDPAAAGNNCLAVVGSRRLTSYGRRATEQLVTEIAASGITIVSGFMYGGDEAAHSAAVRCGGKTIAVMPCGINIIFPEYQKELYNEILENNGLILSEYEGDFLPQTWSFVQRDRIVAGLAKAVLVTEASLNSGSLITANYAKKFGRKIFALPGQITSDVAKGTTKLIKEGAEPVVEANDILSFYKVLVNPHIGVGVIPGLTRNPVVGAQTLDSGLRQNDTETSLEKNILEYLGREPMEVDSLARALCVPAAKLGTTLSLMHLKGLINLEGQKYYLN